ncbi:hypothetical protein Tco_0180531 [Tanacetum coccineum]
MLKKFDREDLDRLWSLVKKTFSTIDPTEDKEKELWVELKRLYEPDPRHQLWALQKYMHDPLEWRLYDTCGVHHVSTKRGHEIFMLVEKDYPLTKGLTTVMLFGDSYKVPLEETAKDKSLTGKGSGSTKKKGRTVSITVEDMQKQRNDVKARTTIFLALPDEHQLRFSKYETAKELWEAILKTFGGNEATKRQRRIS